MTDLTPPQHAAKTNHRLLPQAPSSRLANNQTQRYGLASPASMGAYPVPAVAPSSTGFYVTPSTPTPQEIATSRPSSLSPQAPPPLPGGNVVSRSVPPATPTALTTPSGGGSTATRMPPSMIPPPPPTVNGVVQTPTPTPAATNPKPNNAVSFLRGMASPITGLFTPQGLLTTAAVVGAGALVGPAALAPWLLLAGGAFTLTQGASGLNKIANGRTDEERAEGWYDMGAAVSGAIGTGLGAKPAAMGVNAQGVTPTALWKAPLQYLKEIPKDLTRAFSPRSFATSLAYARNNVAGLGNRLQTGQLFSSGASQTAWGGASRRAHTEASQAYLKHFPKPNDIAEKVLTGSQPPLAERLKGLYGQLDHINSFYRKSAPAGQQPPKSFPKGFNGLTVRDAETLAHLARTPDAVTLYTAFPAEQVAALKGSQLGHISDRGLMPLYTSVEQARRAARQAGVQANVLPVHLDKGTALLSPSVIGQQGGAYYLPRNTALTVQPGGLMQGTSLRLSQHPLASAMRTTSHYLDHRNHYNPWLRDLAQNSPQAYQRLRQTPGLVGDLGTLNTANRLQTLQHLSRMMAQQPEAYQRLAANPQGLDPLLAQVEHFRRTNQPIPLDADLPTTAWRGVMRGVDHTALEQAIARGTVYSDAAPIRVAEQRGIAGYFSGNHKRSGLLVEFRDPNGLPIMDRQLLRASTPGSAVKALEDQDLLLPNTPFRFVERRPDGTYVAEIVHQHRGQTSHLPIDPRYHADNVALGEARKALHVTPKNLREEYVASAIQGGLISLPFSGPVAAATGLLTYPITKPTSLLAGHLGLQAAQIVHPRSAPMVTNIASFLGANDLGAGEAIALRFNPPKPVGPPPPWWSRLNPFGKREPLVTVNVPD